MASGRGNKVYVVTGGNRGLGLGFVKTLLVRPSTTVVASVRDSQAAEVLKAEVASASTGDKSTLYIMQLDFSTAIPPEKVLGIFKAATGDAVDHIDVLICNAGFAPPMVPVVDITLPDLRSAFEVNTIAPLMVYQALRPLLLKASPPKLINISTSLGSIAGMEPWPAGSYGASRVALNWLTRGLHLQEEAAGLVAVALHPGWVKTRAGHSAAEQWNVGVGPNLTVEESVQGMLEVIEGATRSTTSGKFLTNSGEILPW